MSKIHICQKIKSTEKLIRYQKAFQNYNFSIFFNLENQDSFFSEKVAEATVSEGVRDPTTSTGFGKDEDVMEYCPSTFGACRLGGGPTGILRWHGPPGRSLP